MNVRIRKNEFGHYILQDAEDPMRGWSGSRWVAIDRYGLPSSAVQVSNFDTEQEARDYAHRFGFTPEKS